MSLKNSSLMFFPHGRCHLQTDVCFQICNASMRQNEIIFEAKKKCKCALQAIPSWITLFTAHGKAKVQLYSLTDKGKRMLNVIVTM